MIALNKRRLARRVLRFSGVLVIICWGSLGAMAQARTPSTSRLSELPFEGHYRAAVKTSYANGKTAACEPLGILMRSLPSDASMRARYPDISDPETAPEVRVREERHNVCVYGYLYAIKFEGGRHGDNDFHTILGTSPGSDALFLNVEVSGVPRAGDRAPFIQARRELLRILGARQLHHWYTRFRNPPQVRVTGSLYFDADHRAGQVGPRYARPRTVWEIHPVRSIELLGH